ncbi:flavin monoamine oxidase family protein [Chitinophaga pinensis]|uniref:Twin-arginine translocation pathway signal n=1 Tax=Chitinophaga pinensis (strain ATCC 43595 / DSM 2588 / LMG 13176 / NBRC 15968 / NCIMB 11800 / UQM 2034) TaxID=485918 RepID=A0A979G1C9_CHIPD|nr:NAD(P)-binding protein [Chitinophaga pinensis]ACU59064.1 twin-arginine translocation pathway signal [Chitinophaga pinensis DSM 2588]
MRRRSFIQSIAGLTVVSSFLASCQRQHVIKGSVIGASSHTGHLLRDKNFAAPVAVTEHDIVIVGGGISGLSAARHLHRQGITNMVILDLEKEMGGNAACGGNDISGYPWGAHYVPIPNNDLTAYTDFMRECGVITSPPEAVLPTYNEYYICFDPEERLYINGQWQEGLIPQFGVPDAEKKQIQQFLDKMQAFRIAKGEDGKDAFAIPLDNSSKDPVFTTLDQLTMKEWLHQQGWTSPYLQWYVNYCTRDDYGTTYDEISAWVGIQYFASRKGKGSNADHHDVLTWPEGNGWLAAHLKKELQPYFHNEALVARIQEEDGQLAIDYFDVKESRLKRIKARQCILAVPQFVAGRILHDEARIRKVHQHIQYSPWMVANIRSNALEERTGYALSWDNVIYDSPSLGYVEANHQQVEQGKKQKNLTYYLPLTGKSPVEERKAAIERTHTEWVKMIVDDLDLVHPDIATNMEEVNVMIWGHAMAKPLPGIAHGTIRQELGASINDRLHFAHTDLAGNSLFEEAFYQGLTAAQKVMTQLSVKI